MIKFFFVEYEKIFGTEHYKLGKIFKIVKSFNFEYALRTACTLNLAIEGKKSHFELQDHVLALFFDDKKYKEISKNLNSLIFKRKEETVCFHRQQLLLFLKILLIHGDPNNNSFFKETKDKIGRVLFSLNTCIERKSRFNPTLIKETEVSLAQYFIPLNFFSSSNNYDGEAVIHKLVRTLIIWEELYPTHRNNKKIKYDYESDFKELLGITFKDYLQILFAVYLHFADIDVKTANATAYFFNETQYFKNTKLDIKDVKKVINTCKLNLSTFQQEYKRIIDKYLNGNDNYLFNFVVFQDKPLLEFKDGSIFPIDLGFFVDKVADGIYWELNNSYGTSDSQKRDFLPHMMGMLFQDYIILVLQQTFGESFFELEKSTQRRADGAVIIDLPSGKKCLIVLEIKHIRLKLQTLLKRDLEASMNDFEKLLGEKDGLGQIYSTIIQLFNDGLPELSLDISDIEFIIPIVITSEFIPDEPFSRKFYEENFINQQKSQLPEDIKNVLLEPYIVSVDEIEMIEALVRKEGTNKLIEIFLERNRIVMTKNSNGFHELLPPIRGVMINKGYSYKNQRIKKRFKKFTSDVEDYLFEND